MNSRLELYYKNKKHLGMSRYNALISAGFPDTVADRYRLVEDVPSFIDLFERKGMSDQGKVKHILEGLRAEKVVSVETDERTAKGQKIYKEVTVPDWTARHKYLETMLKLCRQLDEKQQSNTVIFDLAERIKEARERTIREVKFKNIIYEEPKEVSSAS